MKMPMKRDCIKFTYGVLRNAMAMIDSVGEAYFFLTATLYTKASRHAIIVPIPTRPIRSGILCKSNGIQAATAAIIIKKKFPGAVIRKCETIQCTHREKTPNTIDDISGSKLKLIPTAKEIISPNEQASNVIIRLVIDDMGI
jgi:hypothetical protein